MNQIHWKYQIKRKFLELCVKISFYVVFNSRFKQLYRLTKLAFQDLLDDIIPYLKKRRTGAIPPIIKLAVTLRFLAEGTYQRGVGQDYLTAMAQPTVSKCIAEILLVLEQKKCAEEINFKMSEDEKQQCKQHFFKKYGFPGIIGSIDGTFIAIIRPSVNEQHFYNRKGFHSINAMIVRNLLI